MNGEPGSVMLTADSRSDVPVSIQVGIRLAMRYGANSEAPTEDTYCEYVLQVLSFVGPGRGYRWVDVETVHQNLDGTDRDPA